jgi:hypothetical protein
MLAELATAFFGTGTLHPQPNYNFFDRCTRMCQQNDGLSKSLLKKMQSLLRECDVPESPIPTRIVCDMLDAVKKDAVALLSLRTQLAKKVE